MNKEHIFKLFDIFEWENCDHIYWSGDEDNINFYFITNIDDRNKVISLNESLVDELASFKNLCTPFKYGEFIFLELFMLKRLNKLDPAYMGWYHDTDSHIIKQLYHDMVDLT